MNYVRITKFVYWYIPTAEQICVDQRNDGQVTNHKMDKPQKGLYATAEDDDFIPPSTRKCD